MAGMNGQPDSSGGRGQELAERLAAVRRRIDRAAKSAGRPASPQLIVVTKFFPARDVRILASLKVADVGENRDQEASAKASECADLDLRWHFIGQLQTNKAKSVVRYAHAVHSVDRLSLVDALERAVAAEQRRRAEVGLAPREPLACLVQVGLGAGTSGASGGEARGGAAPEEVQRIAERIAAAEGLRISGVMAVAPRSAEPAAAFRQLADISAAVRSEHPKALAMSAGMSGDLEAAVAAGATHLRIGADVLGERPRLR
jgi:pyridoxal phosphate enzyme (YggS family)